MVSSWGPIPLGIESKRRLKVMADYGCHALWDVGPTGPSNVNPKHLPISNDLMARFHRWSRRYDKTLDRSDPSSSGFAHAAEHRLFVVEGWALSKELAKELGTGWYVVYFDDLTGETRQALDGETA